MKKNLLMMAAIMFGILIAFASCKDKKSKTDDDEDEKTEKVKKSHADRDDDEFDEDEPVSKKDIALKKVASLEDIETLSDNDLDDIDISDLTMEDFNFDDIDLENLDEEQANALLDLVVLVANKELPEEVDEDMTMTTFEKSYNNVTIVLEMGPKAMDGASMEDIKTVLNMPDVKNKIVQNMMESQDSENEDFKKFMQVIAAANKNMVLRFVDKATGEYADLKLTASELSQLKK